MRKRGHPFGVCFARLQAVGNKVFVLWQKLNKLNKNKPLRWVLPWLLIAAGSAFSATPDSVKFSSRDGKTELTGFLFKPSTPGPHAAVVMLHGRAGSYSTLKPGVVSGANLTARHRMWGEFWAARGYLALHVDSFGPRGYAQGFPQGSYKNRPAEVNEQLVRPLDAYGALDYLRTRNDVIADRIGVQGWSNGGMTLLAALGQNPPRVAPEMADRVRLAQPTPASDFRAAIAQYPGCVVQRNAGDYQPYAPLMLLVASDDDEVSPTVCAALAQQLKQRNAEVAFVLYEGAHHSYDDPGKTKQSHAPNKAALEDTLRRAEAFFRRHLQAGN
jgi:dienelactone hydrolase